MGRKQSRLTGLSFFAKDVFAQPAEGPNIDQPVPDTTASSTLEAGAIRKASDANLDEDKSKPVKKRKLDVVAEGNVKYDATGLVPHYTDSSQVPEHLRKYFFQRERYFSLYSKGCLLDEEGWYSVTAERIADQIAERCRCDIILDAFCGVGGNAIAFAKTCERVIALDTNPVRLALARHNAIIYGVVDRIEFILADYLSFARSYLTLPNNVRKIDVVFLSPPWGGPAYLDGSKSPSSANTSNSNSEEEHPEYSLSSIQPIHGAELFKLTRRITRNVAFFLPRNTNLSEISELLTSEHSEPNGKGKEREDQEMVEVEEEWMGCKLKALTCYFGGLVVGQEQLFDT